MGFLSEGRAEAVWSGESLSTLRGALPLNPACQPWKEIGWQVRGQPSNCGGDYRFLTGGREMTTSQPSMPQRDDKVVLAGVLGCSLRAGREVGVSPQFLCSPQRSRLPEGLACIRNRAIRPIPPLLSRKLPSTFPQSGLGAGAGALGLVTTGFKNGMSGEREKESEDSRKPWGL